MMLLLRAAIAATGISSAAAVQADGVKKPNILFIFTGSSQTNSHSCIGSSESTPVLAASPSGRVRRRSGHRAELTDGDAEAQEVGE
jgi:hypothetical protein